MIPVLLILVPLISGLALFAFRSEATAKKLALISSGLTLLVSLAGLTVLNDGAYTKFTAEWMPAIRSNFRVELDGMGQLLCLLTAVSFPLIFISTYKNEYRDGPRFFAFMLLSQAGLMGVFLAMDALLFYFFWEL